METLLLQINLDESYFINRQSKIFLDFEHKLDVFLKEINFWCVDWYRAGDLNIVCCVNDKSLDKINEFFLENNIKILSQSAIFFF